MKQINAIGDTCPMPVIKTKKALSEIDSDQLEVLVDNEIAVQNIQKYIKSTGGSSSFSKQGEHFVVQIKKNLSNQENLSKANDTPISTLSKSDKTLVVISSDCMGSGDDELGKILIKGFVFALTQLDTLPNTILLYNTGARLSIKGSPVLNDLIALNKAGVNILTCGTCLNHFKIVDDLGVGEISNMYTIVEEMQQASHILRP